MIRVCLGVLLASALFAADKPSREIQELQRDVAQLQESVKALQKLVEERMTGLGTQVQGAADAAGKAGEAVTTVQRGVEQLAKDQEQKLAPIATVGGRLDNLTTNLGTTQQAIADLTSVVNKLQTQISDLAMAVKVAQTPVAPPGPPMSATDMFTNAERDRTSGKLELALPEFEDYLKWYGDSAQAHLAAYAIGSIHFSLKDYENAVKGFDRLLAQYPTSAKAAEALYYKSKSLESLGRKEEAAEARKELSRRFPKNPLALSR